MGVDDPETLVGKTDYDFYPPEQAANFRRITNGLRRAALINREERGRNRR